jgi:hypothetical protein
MIERKAIVDEIKTALTRSQVVALIGPRQSGKTTLARQFLAIDSLNYFDLEDPVSSARLQEPMTALQDLRGLVVIDEIQRKPDLFPVLRVLADRVPLPSRFLILGSASSELIKSTGESLAGRVETIQISGFSLAELGSADPTRHWLRGGFPRSYLSMSEEDSFIWRKNFVQTFLERDLPQWGVRVPSSSLLRFWTMLAHYHGQIWNASEPARSLGVAEPTIRRYLDILDDVYMVRVLQPWHANIKKRQVKSPKILFRDSGILHYLLGIRTLLDLENHPKNGASWEGYAIEEVIKAFSPDEAYYWATHNNAELDLLLIKEGHRYGIECKKVDAPRVTPSMHIALQDLELESITIIYPGSKAYPLGEKINVLPLRDLADPDLLMQTSLSRR